MSYYTTLTIICDECGHEEEKNYTGDNDVDPTIGVIEDGLKKKNWAILEPSSLNPSQFKGNYYCCPDCRVPRVK